MNRILTLFASALLGAAAGVASSAIHPGATGARGHVGAQGPAGPVGPAGSAASTSALGICVTTTTDGYGTWYVSNVGSPSQHSDGTTYCAAGSYVPVKPQ